MTWVRDADGNLLNLAHIESIEIVEFDEDELDVADPGTHGVRATSVAESDRVWYLFLGSEEDCKHYLGTLGVAMIPPYLK